MQKRSSKGQSAKQPKAATTSKVEPERSSKNPAAVALGRLGGLKGGIARAKKLSPEQRKAIARKAVETRWSKAKQ
jgi:hypothetical protein